MHGVYTHPEDVQLRNQGSKTPRITMVCTLGGLDYIILYVLHIVP